jgi:hypothetical protein
MRMEFGYARRSSLRRKVKFRYGMAPLSTRSQSMPWISSRSSAGDFPLAYNPPTSAPMLVPAT